MFQKMEIMIKTITCTTFRDESCVVVLAPHSSVRSTPRLSRDPRFLHEHAWMVGGRERSRDRWARTGCRPRVNAPSAVETPRRFSMSQSLREDQSCPCIHIGIKPKSTQDRPSNQINL